MRARTHRSAATDDLRVNVVGGALILLVGGLTLAHTGNDSFWTAFNQIAQTIAAALAALACAWRAHSVSLHGGEAHSSRPWWILALGMAFWAFAQGGWTVSEVFLGTTPPSPSWLDAPFLASTLLLAGGILAMVETPAGVVSKLRAAAEGLLIVTGLFLISWCAVVASILSQGLGSPLSQVVNLAYPALDAIAIAAAIFTAVAVRHRAPAGLGLLATGMFCTALADSAFWYASWKHEDFPGVSWIDPLWLTSSLLVAMGALQTRRGRWVKLLRNDHVALAIPVMPAAAGAVYAIVASLTSGIAGPPEVVYTISGSAVLLALSIQVIVVNENRKLTRHLEELVRHQAEHDALTGLSNRSYLIDCADSALARAQRTGMTTAVVLLDLDGFRNLNDTLGHDVGDEVLRVCAERLQRACRAGDLLARFGGDEFVVLGTDFRDDREAVTHAERMLDALEQPLAIGGDQYEIAANAGIATVAAGDSTVLDMLQNADAALHHGRSHNHRAELFAGFMLERANERFQMETDLRRALDQGAFQLVYQPSFDVETMRMKGFEALLRWHHPERGTVPPMEFIPLAEETGLIVPIGEWVLSEALRQVAEWQRDRVEGIEMSVNVAAPQLSSRGFVESVREALERHAVEPARVVLEVTETAMLDEHVVYDTLNGLRALGVRLAVDDFGTGYASFSYLKKLPVDILKIDRSFIADVETSSQSAELVEAILKVGQSLSLQTVAEGIEIPEQIDVLRRLGCTTAQGFLMGKPMAPADAELAIGTVFERKPSTVVTAGRHSA